MDRSFAKWRLAALFVGHVTIYAWHTRDSLARQRFSRLLLVHILVGLLETFRFAYLDVHHDPVARSFDVLLCILQSITNVLLVRRLRRGLRYVTPASYMSGAIMRPALSYLAYSRAIPRYHRISISAIDGFLYTRTCIFALRFAPRCIQGSYARRYAISVHIAGLIGFMLPGAYRNEVKVMDPQRISGVDLAIVYTLLTVALSCLCLAVDCLWPAYGHAPHGSLLKICASPDLASTGVSVHGAHTGLETPDDKLPNGELDEVPSLTRAASFESLHGGLRTPGDVGPVIFGLSQGIWGDEMRVKDVAGIRSSRAAEQVSEEGRESGYMR